MTLMRKKKLQRKRPPKKLGSITIKISVTVDTLTAVMLLVQEVLALLRAVKLPLQVEKEGF